MKDNNKIVMLPRDLLHPHPDNPRKDLGDLEELKESIKAHGIMQNLTVVPDEEDGYKILIGHRRFAASEGILDELPCVVTKGLSDLDQLGIMLVENIQRNDLSFVEQAHGFQMMMDLGDTVETIAEKTGFSKATVKHRLEIAKLNDKAITQDRQWQLSISDLVELEKVPNVKDRNQILKEANDPMNLRYKVRQAVNKEHHDKNMKQAKSWFKKLGIKEDINSSMWSSDVQKVAEFNITEENPKNFTYEHIEKLLEKHKSLFWQSRYTGDLNIFKKVKNKTEKPKKTAAEIKAEERLKKKKEVNHYSKDLSLSYGNFIIGLPIDLAKRAAADVHIESDIWKYLVKHDAGIAQYKLDNFINDYNERGDYWNNTFPTLPTVLQMLLMLIGDAADDFICWNEELDADTVELHRFIIESLKPFGYNFPEEIPEGVLDFNSEIYSFLKEDK